MNGHDLAAALNVTPEVLYGWNRGGYLHPEYLITGEGKTCRYGDRDVVVATKMARLVKAGLPARFAHKVVAGDVEARVALMTALDGATMEPILEPMARDEPAAEQALRDAMDIATAVRDVDPRDLWPELEAMHADEPRRLLAALVALAAMVPVETPVSELLAWTDALDARGAA